MRKVLLTFGLLMFAASGAAFAMQDSGNEVFDVSTAKFGPNPALPACAKVAAAHGDPSKGNFVLLLKAAAGCTIPTHWHTAAEQVGVASGMFKLTMKGEQPKSLKPGSYAYMPGKSQHSAQCATACMVFVASDQPFDIHYVDASGNEIPPEQALKSGGKAASKSAKPGASKKGETGKSDKAAEPKK